MNNIDLRVVISDLRQRTENVWISADEHAKGDHSRRWKFVRQGETELADYLRATYGARIGYAHFSHIITMCGIRSSATSDLMQAFRNWAAAAEKKADAS